MKARISVDMTSLVHKVVDAAAKVHAVTQAHALLYGEAEMVLGDAGYRGGDACEENQGHNVRRHIAMRPSKRRPLGRSNTGLLLESYEYAKKRLRSRVELPFRVIKYQFDFAKVRYRGLTKNTAQMKMLFALANIGKVYRHLMATVGLARQK